MEYNYSKLLGKIAEVFGTQSNFANAMGMSERTLSLKLNCIRYFKQPEIEKAVQLLKIPIEEIAIYFFNQNVQKS